MGRGAGDDGVEGIAGERAGAGRDGDPAGGGVGVDVDADGGVDVVEQPCITPGVTEAKDRPVASVIGSASMSARITSLRCEAPAVPVTSTATPWPAPARTWARPAASSAWRRLAWLAASWLESSG